MKTDNINKMFKNLEGDFDIESPSDGHKQRFLDKLEGNNETLNVIANKKSNIWKPLLAIAASIVLMLSFITYSQDSSETYDLANVSPEMATTQDFFTNTITSELEKLYEVKSPETQKLVDDAIYQISILEEHYKNLKVDLNDSGNDKRVIFAMISNFQNRIEILQSVIEQIENVKQLNNNQNEKSTTI